jgi:hypothetical protein
MPQFPALLVDEADELDLSLSAAKLDTTHLPQHMISVPLSDADVTASAILSWRWDTDINEPSRNLRASIRLARHLRKQYLFIDVISITQKLPPHRTSS